MVYWLISLIKPCGTFIFGYVIYFTLWCGSFVLIATTYHWVFHGWILQDENVFVSSFLPMSVGGGNKSCATLAFLHPKVNLDAFHIEKNWRAFIIQTIGRVISSEKENSGHTESTTMTAQLKTLLLNDILKRLQMIYFNILLPDQTDFLDNLKHLNGINRFPLLFLAWWILAC